ncbi:A-factor type gamma-butyrolactone 6-reductase ScbB [Kitasatospora albolonga]|uniref:SDR family NAD(P)-dependent oxidoreductase n=1 Tax=Kitasatospora albolonga TaxID=68173 RepID=UPI0031ED1746
MGALEGKTALVTGASRGIGRGIARRLAADGALVVVHYGVNEAAAEETVRLIEKDGGRAVAAGADLAELDGPDLLCARLWEALAAVGADRGLDVLVNNAALSGGGHLAELSAEHYDRLHLVNTRSPLLLIQRLLPDLREGGRIVNISSAATRVSFPESIGYAMTKGALEALTLALAKDLGPRNITVNTVAPGYVATDMNARRRTTPEAAASLAALSALDRIGSPEDIAEMVAFLASPAAGWTTGQRLEVSGGLLI